MEARLMEAHPDLNELQRLYRQRPFSVFSVNRQVKRPGEPVSYSTIHSAFIIPVRGRARFSLGDEELIGQPGTVLHGCPHRHLRFEALDEEPFEHINIYYSADTTGLEEGEANWMMRPYAFEPVAFGEVLARVEALEALGFFPSLENRLNQIIGATELVKSLFNTEAQASPDERIARVRAHLETHFADPITLAELAEGFGLSEHRLSLLFQRAYGIRPIGFLIACRLEHACQLLKTDMKVKDVALAVGYEDPLYFSRLFRKRYGCPPSAMRA